MSQEPRHRGQRGFTLIELMVVVAILGLLSAVATVSLVGLTRYESQQQAASELKAVQTAYNTMLVDQQVASGSECGAVGDGTTEEVTVERATAFSLNQSVLATSRVVYAPPGKLAGPNHGTRNMDGTQSDDSGLNHQQLASIGGWPLAFEDVSFAWRHGGDGSHLPGSIYPHYFTSPLTVGSYHCTTGGVIVQDSYPGQGFFDGRP